MQSKNSTDNQAAPVKRTFIEEARRTQIIDATIEVLADYGYINLSFARIAKHAGISPSLISYHFKDKQDLINEVIMVIAGNRIAHSMQSIASFTTAKDRLKAVIEADLAYMGTRPKHFQAMVEITFNSRDSAGKIVYLGDEDDPMVTMLCDILESGQKNGEFGEFDAYNLAMIIDGARDTFLAQLPLRAGFNLENFTKSIVEFAVSATKKGTHE